jgi:hypothetical protein
MLHTTVTITFSEEQPVPTSPDRVHTKYRSQRTWSGNADTITSFGLLEGVARAFAEADIDNAISLKIDNSMVYLDANDEPHDLELMLDAASESKALEREFKTMHLVFSQEDEGLRIIFDTKVDSDVLTTGGQLTLAISARIQEMQIQRGESAKEYADRLKAWASDQTRLEQYKVALERKAEALSTLLGDAFPTSDVSHEPVTVKLHQPTAEQVGNFRNLSFGNRTSDTAFRTENKRSKRRKRRTSRKEERKAENRRRRARSKRERQRSEERSRRRSSRPSRRNVDDEFGFAPETRRSRKHNDRSSKSPSERRASRQQREVPTKQRRRSRRAVPTQRRVVDVYDNYLYDPYWDYASFVLLHAMLYDHVWHVPYVHIVDPYGSFLGAGMYVEDFLMSDPWFHAETIGYDYDGGLYVSEDIQYVDSYDHGHFGEEFGTYEDFDTTSSMDDDFDDYGDYDDYDDSGYDDFDDDDGGDWGDDAGFDDDDDVGFDGDFDDGGDWGDDGDW